MGAAPRRRRRGRLCRRSAAGSAPVDRPPQPFRRDGGESRHRAAAAGDRACRRTSRERARQRARAARSISSSTPFYTTQDVAVAVAFLITEIVEFAMLHCADRSGRDFAPTNQRADRAAVARQPGARPDDDERSRRKSSSSGSSAASPSSCARRSTASLARYSVDLPVFPPAETDVQIVTAAAKKVSKTWCSRN